jgi:hypothetical protein
LLQFTEDTRFTAFYTIVAPNGEILTSPNSDILPEPLTGAHLAQIPDDISDYGKVLWGLPNYPYLAFISQTPVFWHYPLNRLAITVDTTPLDHHPTKGWRFPEQNSRSWISLQSALLHLGTTLLSWVKHASPQHHLSATIPPLPETFGFTKFHQTAEDARKCLGYTIDSFVVLIAFVSYAIAVSTPSGNYSNPDAPWMQYMLEMNKGHPSWYDGIRNSFITKFLEKSRVGMIVNVSNCPPPHLLKCMIACRIPVWFHWGLPPLPLSDHAIAAKYRPLLGNSSGPSEPSLPNAQSSREPFKVERNSRQKPGETWREYLARRRVQTDQIKARESASERSRRLDRERAQAKRQQPGQKGPTVWHWEDKGGYRVRTLMTRAEAGFLWSHYSNAQCKYDSFSNEYDICTEFGSDDEGGSRYDSGAEDDENIEGTPPYPMPPFQATGEPKGLALPSAIDQLPEQGLPGRDVLMAGVLPSSSPSPHTQEPQADLPKTACTNQLPQLSESDKPAALALPTAIDQLPEQGLPSRDVSMAGVLPSSSPSPHTQEPEVDLPKTASTNQLPQLSESDKPAALALTTAIDPLPEQGLPSRDVSMAGVLPSSSPSPHTQEPEVDLPKTASTNQQPQLSESDKPVALALTTAIDPLPEQGLPSRDVPMAGVLPSSPPSSCTQEPDTQELDPPKISSANQLPELSDSALDVLEGHSYTPPDHEEISTGDLADLLYYRFGYIGSSSSGVDYSSTFRFNSWNLVCSAVGGNGLQCPESERSAIMFFLSLLLDPNVRLQDIPNDLWDLSPENLQPLAEVPTFFNIVDMGLKTSTPYILRPRGLHPSRDCAWFITVNALTALQCIRRSLGPHTVDIASDLVSRGIPFRTFAKFERPDTDVSSPSFIVPDPPFRLREYTFDLADYVTYETMRDSFLRDPRCRAALQVGGIVWRLAQQSLPDSAVLSGPSQDARNGFCEVISCGEEKFCDDALPDAALDFICGVYKVQASHGKYFHPRV